MRKLRTSAALEARPNSGFGLYGVAIVKEASGDAAGATEAYAAFLKAWPKADADLPEVAHAQKMVGTTYASLAMRSQIKSGKLTRRLPLC